MAQTPSNHPITRSSDHLLCELVTPERLAYAAPVAMVEVPGELGDFGVLAGHAPFMSIIRAGVVTVHEADGTKKRFFVPGGYAEVNPEGCTVLAEQLRDLSEVTAEDLARELEIARIDLADAKDDHAQRRAERAMMLAEMIQQAARS